MRVLSTFFEGHNIMNKAYREIQTYLHEAELPYTGPELRPHFILQKFKVEGSALTAFIGPCDVKTDHLVDWEDRLQNDSIRAKSMVHFLGEFFGISLREGVWIQRLLVSELCQRLQALPGVGPKGVYREGDDLFWTGGGKASKLSVSIVTASPVSVLLHLGINIDATGAPVQAAGLKDLGLASSDGVKSLIKDLLAAFEHEYLSVSRACVKVRPVV